MRAGGRIIESSLAAALTVLVIGLTMWFQKPTRMNGGLGWDDAAYYELTTRIVNGEAPRSAAPFVFRVGLPWAVAHLSPQNLRRGFLMISLPSIVLASVVFCALLRPLVEPPWSRALCFVLFVTQFHGLARFIPFRNFMVDAPATLAVFVGLWMVQRWRLRPGWTWSAALALTTVLGVFVREVALVPAGALLFAGQPLRFGPPGARFSIAGRLRASQILPILTGLAAYALLRKLVVVDGGASTVTGQLSAFWFMAKAKLPFAQPLGWAMTYGPILVLPLAVPRVAGRFLAEHQDLAAALFAIAFLGWVGGSDTERLLFYSAPIVFAIIGRCLAATVESRRDWLWLLPLLALQAVSERWFWTLPDDGPHGGFPFLTTLGPKAFYDDVWSGHMPRMLRAPMLGEYVLVFALFWVVVRARRRPQTLP